VVTAPVIWCSWSTSGIAAAVERAAGMADSERPHLTQADPKFLGHLEKRVLVIELGDPHTGRVA
jgi:hypothetical protein